MEEDEDHILCGGLRVREPEQISSMEIDFGGRKGVNQRIPFLYDIDGNRIGTECKLGIELEFDSTLKYLKINAKKTWLNLRSPNTKHGDQIDFNKPVPAVLIFKDTGSNIELFRLTFDVTITDPICENLSIRHDEAEG